jgi:hypothetical protein
VLAFDQRARSSAAPPQGVLIVIVRFEIDGHMGRAPYRSLEPP